MATFADLEPDHQGLRALYDEWREKRAAKGEDPTDYGNFRSFLKAINFPDTGPRPPDDWVGEDYKQAHPDWWAQYQSR